jgi:hypothetical protein
VVYPFAPAIMNRKLYQCLSRRSHRRTLRQIPCGSTFRIVK